MSDFSKLSRAFDSDNRTAARIIAADVEKYGGEGSLMVIWARMVLAKSDRSTAPPKLPLFDEEAA